MIVTDCPWSITTDIGAIETAGAVSTVTVAFVSGVAVGVGVAPAVVPRPVTVTVSTHVAVVLVGVYVSEIDPESANPGQLPEATDQA